MGYNIDGELLYHSTHSTAASITAIQQELLKLQEIVAQVADSGNTINDLQVEIGTSINSINVKLTELESLVNSHDIQIGELDSKTQESIVAFSDIQKDLADLQNLVNSLDLDAVQSLITEIQGDISTLSTSVSGLLNRVDANELSLSEIQNDISGVLGKKILLGTVPSSSLGAVTAQKITSYTVNFSSVFTSVPHVVATIFSSSTSIGMGSLLLSVSNITTSSFKINIYNNYSSGAYYPNVEWIAIQ